MLQPSPLHKRRGSESLRRGGAGLGARLGHSPDGCHAPAPQSQSLRHLIEELALLSGSGSEARVGEEAAACLIATLTPCTLQILSPWPKAQPHPELGAEGIEGNIEKKPRVRNSRVLPWDPREHRAPPPAKAQYRPSGGEGTRGQKSDQGWTVLPLRDGFLVGCDPTARPVLSAP